MLNRGIVVSTEGDQCEVVVFRTEACGSCSACSACDAKPTVYRVPNELNAEPGEAVVLEIKNTAFFAGVFALYVVPMIFFLIGLFLCYFLVPAKDSSRDAVAFFGGLAGLLIFGGLMRLLERKLKKKTLVRMIEKTDLPIPEEADKPCN